MALFFEDASKVTKKQIYIPNNAKKVFKAMGDIYKPYIDKNVDGSKIMKSLASDKQYNKKGKTSNANGKNKMDSVSVEDAKVRLHRQDKLNPNSIEYQLYGGKLAHDILKKGVENARGVKTVDAVKPPKPTISNISKQLNDTSKDNVKAPNGAIKLKEGYYDDENMHPFYDYLEDYDERYVLSQFAQDPHGKESWGVLINPSMYEKALQEFTRLGYLDKFPSRYVYQWMGIIMRNTAILIANTNLAGHGTNHDHDAVQEFFESFYPNREVLSNGEDDIWVEISQKELLSFYQKKEVKIPLDESNGVHKDGQYDLFYDQDQVDAYDAKKSELEASKAMEKKNASLRKRIETVIRYINDNDKTHTIEERDGKYYVGCDDNEALWDIGFFDWMQMPDGSDAYSDFGIEPLMNVIDEYRADLAPEKVLVIVNKALDVYHQRGDMASIFIQGGSEALSSISEEIAISKGGKKIYIRENQLITLNDAKKRTDMP